jgi:putative transposase
MRAHRSQQMVRAQEARRRRFGYRRLHVLLRREGFKVNHKRLFRLYREERLTVRRRGGRKRALGTRAPMLVPQLPNERWSLDFVADQFIDGRRMRILVVVDDCTRECLALVPDTSISGIRVAANSTDCWPIAVSRRWLSPTTSYVGRYGIQKGNRSPFTDCGQ